MSPRSQEQGFSLVELVVALSVISLALAVMFGFLNHVTALTTRTGQDVRQEEELQLAMRTVTEDLRGAAELSACASAPYTTCLTFSIPRSASVGLSCPERQLTYSLTGAAVVETRSDYLSNCSGSTTAFAGRTVISGVVGGAPLFTYYDKNGNAIDPAANPSQVASAVSIGVTITVATGTPNAPNLTLSSVASLRNKR